MQLLKFILSLLILLVGVQAYGQGSVQVNVVALFNGKAMLAIDGARAKVVKAGESYKGVKLVSSSTSEAVIEVAGKQRALGLQSGTVLSKSLAAKPASSPDDPVQVWENRAGFFIASGAINGRGLEFLVDTGANLVVLSSNAADAIGLEYRQGKRGIASTASGQAPMFLIELDEISFDSISLNDIQAGVIQGSYPEMSLLGMSFLRHLELQRSGNVMTLKKRF